MLKSNVESDSSWSLLTGSKSSLKRDDEVNDMLTQQSRQNEESTHRNSLGLYGRHKVLKMNINE